MLRRLLAIAVLVAGTLPVLSGVSWACSCAPPPPQPYRSAAHDAELIYVGRVVAERIDRSNPRQPPRHSYDVEVRRELKGDAGGFAGAGEIRTLTGEGYGCEMTLDRGRVLVVDDSLSICGRTTQHRLDARIDAVRHELQRMGGYRPSTHVVERGDWLYRIARQRLRFDPGTVSLPPCSVRDDCDDAAVRRAARDIYEANRARIGPDPDRLRPGMRLRIPRLR